MGHNGDEIGVDVGEFCAQEESVDASPWMGGYKGDQSFFISAKELCIGDVLLACAKLTKLARDIKAVKEQHVGGLQDEK